MIADNGITESAEFGAGLYLQGGANVTIDANEFSNNTHMAIGVHGSSHAIISNNVIADTRKGAIVATGTCDLGDGIALYEGASATISPGNVIRDNWRAGIIGHQANGAATSIAGNTITGNQHAIVLQGETDNPATVGENAISGNGSDEVVRLAGIEYGLYCY